MNDINNIFHDLNNEIFLNKKKKNLLTNKKFLLIVAILIFVFTSITVGKAFYLRNKVNNYEKEFIEITTKDSIEMIIESNQTISDKELNKVAAEELINCIKTPPNKNELPDNVKKVINKINNFYNESLTYFSFKYKDLYTGFTVSYNEHQKIFSASSIKAPKDIYIYEMASLNKINLDEKLTYTRKYYNNGSGVLKNKKFNTEYTVRKLLEYSTVTSDNAAHNMLMNKYGRKNMLNFWKEKGTEAIFTKNTNWGLTNAHDATIYMEELYNFYLKDEIYGKELMNNFLNAYPTFLKGKNNYKVANKSGWAGTAIHDMAIIFADNPYIVVALSNTGESNYTKYFNTANELAYELHQEYWKYKMSLCSEIMNY
ncbi:MAG: serine hydrolase [Bacilli bacterium]|nr:serine hydrolase [Bacilli bacterium]